MTTSFAQKKAVKEAKSSMDSKNFTEARALIAPALTNPETATDAETWKVAGDIENTAFEQERNNQLFQKDFKEPVMYEALMATYVPYITADSLGQLPDEKGKIKNKYRKDIIKKFTENHPYFINGGVYYNDKKDYSKAADFFYTYWQIPSLAMYEGEKDNAINTNDSTFQTIKYYAVLCAIQADQHNRAIDMLKKIQSEPFTANSTYDESGVYELLATEYQEIGDSVSYKATLLDGANKFPSNQFLTANLINQYINENKYDEAIDYLDKAIANNPNNACDLISTKAYAYAQMKEFKQAEDSYTKALATDPNCEKALDGLSVAYLLQIQDLKNEASTKSGKESLALDDQAKELYKKTLPLLVQYKSALESRSADNSILSNIVYKLQNVYYNLNMNDEYKKTSEELKTLTGE